MQSQPNSEIIQRINEEIESIRQHPHINDIECFNNFSYKLTYSPTTTNSPHRHKIYTIELILPTTYPQDPPSLRFLDQIYHLNVGFSSGEVRMSVLQDDWSPFLTLNSVLQSLDQVLEQPEEDYALDQDTLNLYCHDREKYTNKVLQNTNLADVVLCNSTSRRELSSSSPVRQLTREPSPNKKEKSKILVQDLRQSMQFTEEDNINEEEIDQKGENCNVKPETTNIYSKKAIQKQKSKPNKKDSLPMDVTQSIQTNQIKLNAHNRIATRAKTFNNQTNSQPEEPTNLMLHKINETIGVFISELNQIEDQMQSAKNASIKTLLMQKHEGQLEMLRELMELSEEAKRKIVKKLRQEIKQFK